MFAEVNFLQSKKQITYAIDASSANKKDKTGVETYAFQLIQAMKQYALLESERVVLFSPTPLEGALADLPNGWESRVLRWILPFGWMQVRVSWELFHRPPQVFFVPAQGLPHTLSLPVLSPPFTRGEYEGGLKLLTTIHDVGFRRFLNVYDSKSRRRIARATKRSIRHAQHLITVSEFSKREILDLYSSSLQRGRIGGGLLTVTPLAADQSVYRRLSQNEIEPILTQHRLGHNFFLYVGRLDKKKNVEILIRAFDQFKEHRGIGDPFQLVLVGDPGYGFDAIKKYIELSTAQNDIHVLGHLPDAHVSALMNAATAFLFPSWYEGFGIPNLEAMACGTPLIVSDIPAHREVIGDAGIFLSPSNPEAWVQALNKIVEDDGLKDSLVQKGFARVKMFSWSITAQMTWNVLRNMVE